MNNTIKDTIHELRDFLILWITQSLSTLGSSMTNFAVVIWAFQQQGSALTTALLTICSYAPYVILSIFAGALSDRWNKRLTMLISDSFAALCTAGVLILLLTGNLKIWHLYLINTLNGLMNTVQQPTSDVAVSLLCPQKHYQRVSGMRSFSNSLVTVLTPVLATALLSFTSLYVVILFDLITFLIAFTALLFYIRIPEAKGDQTSERDGVLHSAKQGLRFLGHNRGILNLILFLAVINFTASIYNAALPALLLLRPNGGELALGIVHTVTGLAAMAGSVLVTLLPAPKKRTRVICACLLFSMSTENFLLAFGRTVPVWCLGAVCGWLFIPVMNANMDVIFRTKIPLDMQGRVYSARNTLQFFTIPLGYLCGGFLVDKIFEPFLLSLQADSFFTVLFGTGKGAGAAMLFFFIGIFGALSCLPFWFDRHIRDLDRKTEAVEKA